MKKILALVSMCLVAFSATTALAQKPAGPGAGMKMPSPQETVEKLDKEVGLKMSAAQKTKMAAVIKDTQAQAMNLMATAKGADGKLDMTKLQKAGQTLQAKTMESVKKILNADQFKKFQDYQSSKMSQMRGNAKGGKG